MSNLGDKLVLGTVVAGLLFFMTAEAKADDFQDRFDCLTRSINVPVELGQGMIDLIAWECAANEPNPITGKITPSSETLTVLLVMQMVAVATKENN